MSVPVPAGTITIAGKPVSHLGLVTIRRTGPGLWGNPPDHCTAIHVTRVGMVRRAPACSPTADPSTRTHKGRT
jgi:pyridoxine 4-dehydrogenase